MANFNKVILVGNLTRDPQVRYTPKGTAVTEISLAINSTWTDKTTNTRKEEVTFVDVTLWGRTAELAGEYLAKGKQVLIEGRLKLDSWDDKESGQKRSKLGVVCEEMQFLGSREGGPAGGTGGGGAARGGSSGGGPARRPANDDDFGGPPSRGGGGFGGGRESSPPVEDFPQDDVPF
ncbi:MAG: ssb [Planctomycetaceae bacterium]|nr:ssb [Planctomycetaceae bacterium]